MKKYFFLLIALLFVSGTSLHAQNEVLFEFSDGIDDPGLKNRIEKQISKLLTAINKAEAASSDINYSGIDIDNLASQSIGMLWRNVHFRCLDDDIVEHCLRLQRKDNSIRGYQVRNIAIEMKPINDAYSDNLNQEVCINFDPQGKITDFNLTMGIKQYSTLMKKGIELDDVDRRMQIIHYIEQFRTAYNQKDIKFMENIFSDDALIITGRVVKRVKSEVNLPSDKIEYNVKNKGEYLESLRKVFASNSYINVQFPDESISIKRHGSKPNYYGVTLTQYWNSSNYNDEGIVFLVWDFSNENEPKIHVRTWQPLKETQSSEVFSLKNFKLP